jgi:hypothetical protein
VTSIFASATAAGGRTVNVLPWPGALSTPMSPPISRHKRRLRASPRPVPPNFRPGRIGLGEVLEEAARLLGRHADAGIAHREAELCLRLQRPIMADYVTVTGTTDGAIAAGGC